jgi:hypothetical protein
MIRARAVAARLFPWMASAAHVVRSPAGFNVLYEGFTQAGTSTLSQCPSKQEMLP